MTWDDDTISKLRRLWDEGHSTPEIGRRMGMSKNAIVGKAHRLDLSGRPSPIIRSGQPKSIASVPRDRPKITLPPLIAEPPSIFRGTLIAPPRPVTPDPTPRPLGGPCCWPIGEPRTKAFRFCGDPAVSAKPYCPHHASIAYVKRGVQDAA